MQHYLEERSFNMLHIYTFGTSILKFLVGNQWHENSNEDRHLLKKKVLLDSCSSKLMQAEGKHKTLDQITTAYEPNCCLRYVRFIKENSSPYKEEFYSMGILNAR
jgi:hypothetical protein